jgi:hypothetical protein
MELSMQKVLLKTGSLISPNNLKIKKKFGIGIVGSGKMAEHYIKVIRSFNHKLEAIVSISNNKNASKLANKYKTNLYTSYEEAIINKKNIDAWIICVKWSEIYNCLKLFIKLKQPLLVEKSIAIDSKALANFYKLNKKNFSKISFAYNRNYYDYIFKLIKIINTSSPIYLEGKFFDPYKKILNDKGRKIKKYLPYYITSHWIVLILKILKLLRIKITSISIFFLSNTEFNSRVIKLNLKLGKKTFHMQIYNFPNMPKNHFIGIFLKKGYLEISPIEKLVHSKSIRIVKSIKNKYLQNSQVYKVDNKFKPGLRFMYYDFIKKNFYSEKSILETNIKDLIDAYKICEKLI